MGFFKKLFFKEEKSKETSKIEEQITENIKAGADYSHVINKQEIMCNGCGTVIEGKPRIIKHNGQRFILHKRCVKAMMRGETPKPL